MTDRASTHPEELAAYIADHYGRCALNQGCGCLGKVWLGTACPQWRPVKAKNWDELREEARGAY